MVHTSKLWEGEKKADVKKQHDLYVNNFVGDIKAKPRDFCRCINGQKKETQCITPLKRRNGHGVAESELEQADEFNGQSTDVFQQKWAQPSPAPKSVGSFHEWYCCFGCRGNQTSQRSEPI